jgi:hypothetical protein
MLKASVLDPMVAQVVGERLVVDIETVPLKASLSAEYNPADFSPPANYGAEAAAKWHVKNEATWRAKLAKECSVNPRLGRVLCVGTSVGVFYAESESDESRVLLDFWAEVAVANGYVIGWNSGWDLRFLLIRSMVCGVSPSISTATVREWFKRYTVHPHFDCKAVLTNWDNKVAGEGLDEWAKALGITGKTEGMDGGAVSWMYDEGQHDLIREYCAQDVATTAAIFARVSPYFGV